MTEEQQCLTHLEKLLHNEICDCTLNVQKFMVEVNPVKATKIICH